MQKDVVIRQKRHSVGIDLHFCQHVNFIDRVYRQNFTGNDRALIVKFIKIDIVILPAKPACAQNKMRPVAFLHLFSLNLAGILNAAKLGKFTRANLTKQRAAFILSDYDTLGVFQRIKRINHDRIELRNALFLQNRS